MASNSTRRHSPNFLAAKVLTKVLQGQPLEDALYEHHESKDIALLTFLCYTTMRHYYSLHQRLSDISHRPLDQMDIEVKCLLLLGACQLQYSTLPAPLAVAHVVTAAKKIGKTSAGSLINAILRRYDRAVEPSMDEARYELPRWMIDRIRADYPSEFDDIFQSSTTRAPMTLRINTSEISSSDYCELLQESKISFEQTALDAAITLTKPMSRSKLPGYEDDYFCVQDLASQLPVSLLEPQPDHHILDACAAPGVKSRQIADMFPNNPVDAYDLKPSCSTWNIPTDGRKRQNLVCKQGDLTTMSWWDGTLYDRILLDAPCSGSGTLSRHPDIKVTRNEAHVSQAAELQLKLLNNLWNILAPKGLLVYCTCSIFNEENDDVITRFQETHQDVAIEPFGLPIGRPSARGWQTLPKAQAYDGFFFARLRKRSSSS